MGFISRKFKSRQAIQALVLSLALFPIVLLTPLFGLFVWLLSFYLIYRFYESSSKRSIATRAKVLGRHLSSATADLAFSLAVTGSEFQGAESLARGHYQAISVFARNSLLRSLDGADVRSSLASSFRRQRAVPTTYIVELLLSCNPDLLDIENILEQTEDFTRRDFNEFTQRLNTLLPAYFFAAFFLPFSALILSTLMDSLAIAFLTAFFPVFSLIMWQISNMLFKVEATML
jgi:hypothetical protein